MSCTRNLAASAGFVRPFLGFQPIDIQGDDPALTAANIVKNTILGAPFDWKHNRSEINFATVVGQQDYTLIAPDFGYMNRADLADADGTVHEIEIKTSLTRESAEERPGSIAAQRDDNQGNLMFRLNTRADAVYTGVIQYQRKSIPMTSLASTWAPIPDEQSHIFDWGFLFVLALLTKDSRAITFRDWFLSGLLGAQDSLDATQRNIFLANWLESMTQIERSQGRAAAAKGGR